MSKVSSDERIEAILFAVAEKAKMGLDIEETVKRAKKEILDIWSEDVREIEKSIEGVSDKIAEEYLKKKHLIVDGERGV